MNLEEMLIILEKINFHDVRIFPSEGRAAAWAEILAPVPVDIADEAVTRFYSRPEEPRMLHAGGLLAICKEIRSERRERRVREERQREIASNPHLRDERLMTPVESPFLRWEHARRRPAWQEPEPVRPVITDAEEIVEREATRQKMLRALEAMMTEEERRGLGK